MLILALLTGWEFLTHFKLVFLLGMFHIVVRKGYDFLTCRAERFYRLSGERFKVSDVGTARSYPTCCLIETEINPHVTATGGNDEEKNPTKTRCNCEQNCRQETITGYGLEYPGRTRTADLTGIVA